MKIKRLEKYMKEEEQDFIIDKNHLTSCLMNLPKTHSKWLKYFYREYGNFIKLEDKRKKIFRKKHKYYSTEYDLEIKPNQLIWYIESDEAYSAILLKVSVQKKIVEYLEKVVDKVKSQGYTIKNIIEWERYKLGV